MSFFNNLSLSVVGYFAIQSVQHVATKVYAWTGWWARRNLMLLNDERLML